MRHRKKRKQPSGHAQSLNSLASLIIYRQERLIWFLFFDVVEWQAGISSPFRCILVPSRNDLAC